MGFSGLSIGLNCLKFFFALLTYVLKTSALANASTEPDLEGLQQWELRKDTESKVVEQVASPPTVSTYTLNPLCQDKDENDPVRYTINPLFVADAERGRSLANTDDDEDDDDEEYDSIVGVNPMHKHNSMALPSIKGKEGGVARSRLSEASL